MREILKHTSLIALILILTISSVSAIGENLTATKSLIHFNGTAGVNTFNDEVGNILAVNGTYVDNAVKQLGDASASMNAGNSSSIISPPNANWNFGSNYEIDFWLRSPSSSTSTYHIFWWNTTDFRFSYKSVGSSCYIPTLYIGGATLYADSGAPSNVWNHFVIQQNGSHLELMRNGTQILSIAYPKSKDESLYQLNIVAPSVSSTYIDEFHITSGIHDYFPPSFYAPPGAEYNYTATPSGNPPPSISGLTNSSTTCNSTHVDWLNPGDLSNFNHTAFWRNDNPFYNATNTTMTFTDSGLSEHTWYNYSTRTANMEGAMNATWVNVSVFTQSCTIPVAAAFSCAPTSGNAPGFLTTCTDSSTGSPDTWYWEFGDGNTSVAQNPTNTYGWAGLFNVSLHASKAGSDDWENKTAYINVTWAAPPAPTPTMVAGAGAVIGQQEEVDWSLVMAISLMFGFMGGLIGGMMVIRKGQDK